MSQIVYRNRNGELHCDNGPAYIFGNIVSWYINGKDITRNAKEWAKDHNYPEWKDEDSWSEEIKVHFKLTFG